MLNFIKARVKTAMLEFIAEVLVKGVSSLLVGFGVAGIISSPEFGLWLEREFGLGGECILHVFRRRRQNGNGQLGRLKVEQSVTQAEVQ